MLIESIRASTPDDCVPLKYPHGRLQIFQTMMLRPIARTQSRLAELPKSLTQTHPILRLVPEVSYSAVTHKVEADAEASCVKGQERGVVKGERVGRAGGEEAITTLSKGGAVEASEAARWLARQRP
jgi:hypothetical protein